MKAANPTIPPMVIFCIQFKFNFIQGTSLTAGATGTAGAVMPAMAKGAAMAKGTPMASGTSMATKTAMYALQLRVVYGRPL